MEPIRKEACALADEGHILLTQRGVPIDHRLGWKGPIRLKLAASPM
jgi:hypothetical protein